MVHHQVNCLNYTSIKIINHTIIIYFWNSFTSLICSNTNYQIILKSNCLKPRVLPQWFHCVNSHFNFIVNSFARQRLLYSQRCESSSWVVVPAFLHNFWDAMKSVRGVPTIRYARSLLVNANYLFRNIEGEERKKSISFVSNIQQRIFHTFRISSIVGSGWTTS